MTLCGGVGGVGGYDQLCCPASPKLLLGLDLGLGCDNTWTSASLGFSPTSLSKVPSIFVGSIPVLAVSNC